MIERASLPNRHALSRRRLITVGAGAAAGVAGGLVAAARAAPCSSSTSPRATSSRCRSRSRISSGSGLPDPGGGRNVSQIIASNLQRSGLFAPIDPAAYLEKISTIDTLPRFADWRQINAQALVTGRVTQADGRLKVEFRLWDVFAGQQLHGQQYTTTPDNWRRIAHIISDAIYERLTGEKGYFDSRVVFVDESGPKERRVKRLALMDQDGANVRYLTRGDDLVLTPRFSSAADTITYMSYGQGDPKVYLMNIETGQREIVSNFPGMSFSPRFSPDGQRVIFSLQRGGNSNLFVMDLRSKATTRLTDTQVIDTAPSYSPDGTRISFESDRGGKQQIYVMGGERRPGAAHQLRRRRLLDAGMVAARRLHRLHQTDAGQVRHRHHAGGRIRRADPDRRLSQRRADLGAERTRDHVLPRSRRERRAGALYRRRDRPQRATAEDAEPGEHGRSGRRHRGAVDRRAGHPAHHAHVPHRRRGADLRAVVHRVELRRHGEVPGQGQERRRQEHRWRLDCHGPQHRGRRARRRDNELAVHRIQNGARLRSRTATRSSAASASPSGIRTLVRSSPRSEGTVGFEDLVEGRRCRKRIDESTGIAKRVVIDWRTPTRAADLRPAMVIKGKDGKITKLGARRRRPLPALGRRDPLGRSRRQGEGRRRDRPHPDRERQDPRHHRRSAAGGGAVRGAPAEGPRDHRGDQRHGASSARTTRTSAASSSSPATKDAEPVEYLIPKGKHIHLQDGDVIEKGDYILDGNPAPHDILAIKGVEELAAYLVNEIQEVYRLQGVAINDKHIEVIVRQMLQKVEITDAGRHRPDPRRADRQGSSSTRSTRGLRAEGKKPATAHPVLLGITKASLQTRSFISAASFQETTRVLTEAAVNGKIGHARGPEGERHRRPADPGRHRRHHELAARGRRQARRAHSRGAREGGRKGGRGCGGGASRSGRRTCAGVAGCGIGLTADRAASAHCRRAAACVRQGAPKREKPNYSGLSALTPRRIRR